jgi:hypothetical protein
VLGQLCLELGRQRSRVAPGLGDEARDQAIGLAEQGKEQVLAVDLGVAEAGGESLCLRQSLL